MAQKKRHPVKWTCALVSLTLFFFTALFLEELSPLDAAIYGFFARMASPFATWLFSGFTALGGFVMLLAFCFALVFFMPRKEYRVPLLGNLALSVLLNLSLKNLFARVRPSQAAALVHEAGFSFPSGHTMAAACFYGFLLFLVLHSPWRKSLRYAAAGFLSLLIVLVGASRVYLGAHYASDVLGGLFISIPYLILYTAFVEKYFHHEEIHVKKPGRADAGKLLSSFSYAFEGIAAGLRTERNMVVHFAAIALVTVFGAVLGLTNAEWLLCLLLFGLVLMAELLNTAVETVVDMITREKDPRAKLAKDTAAGAVLAVSIAAALAGGIIFVPKLFVVIRSGLLEQYMLR